MSNARPTNKAAREFSKLAKQHGFKLVRHGKHMVFQHEKTRQQLVISGSPSDHRAVKNNLARMRRMSRDVQAA